jgi:hypothetical protein
LPRLFIPANMNTRLHSPSPQTSPFHCYKTVGDEIMNKYIPLVITITFNNSPTCACSTVASHSSCGREAGRVWVGGAVFGKVTAD